MKLRIPYAVPALILVKLCLCGLPRRIPYGGAVLYIEVLAV